MKKGTADNQDQISPQRLRLFKMISIGFGFLVAVVLGEVVTRIHYFGMDAFSYTKVNSFIPIGVSGFLQSADNPKVLYELKPNIDAYFKLKVFKTNSLGLRDKTYSLTKPENTIRGLVLGDSFTMASGVDIEDAYHSVVEERLNQRPDNPRYELLNFGVGGYNLLNYVGLLEDKVMDYDPDFIVIGYCAFNDYFLPPPEHYKGDFNIKIRDAGKKPFFSFYLAGFIERMFSSAENDSRMFEMQPEQEDFMEQAFTEFSAFSQKHNIPVIISVLSILPDNGNMAIVEKIAVRHNIPLSQSFDRFDHEKLSSYTISPLDHHPNAKAHEIYANALMEFEPFQQLIEEKKKALSKNVEQETP